MKRRTRPTLFAAVSILVLAAIGPLAAREEAPVPKPESSAATSTTEQGRSGGREAKSGDRVGIGSPVTVARGETVEGDVVVFGARALVEGTVAGDVVVVGGKLELKGSVRGDVVGIGSRMKLEPEAEVRGDLVNIAGQLDRTEATVHGQVVNVPLPDVAWSAFAGVPWLPPGAFGWLFAWGKLVELGLFLTGLVLLVAIVPERVVRIGEEAPVRFMGGFFLGVLGYLALGAACILLCITIVGIPLLLLAFTVLKWLGLAGIFYAFGVRLGRAMGRDLQPLGAALLGFLPFGIFYFVPCAGSACWLVLKVTAVGLVLLTRAGGPRPLPVPAGPPPAAPAPG